MAISNDTHQGDIKPHAAGRQAKPPLTVVAVVDAKTLPMLAISLPTWRRHKPDLFELPWHLIVDDPIWRAAHEDLPDLPPQTKRLAWDPPHQYETQRERMLTAWIYAANTATTPWWLKIDADVVALDGRAWWQPEWFSGDSVFVASPWGYTKPADQMAQLDRWAEGRPELAHTEPLALPYSPTSNKCVHPRMASWVSFYRTDWSQWAARLAQRHCGPYRAPIPSQDGYHWYLAARTKAPYTRHRMRRCGWTNCPRIDQLRATAAAALSTTNAEAQP